MRSIRPALALFALLALAAPATAGGSCDPRSADEWSARCLTHGGEIEDLLDDIRHFPALRGIDSLREAQALLAAGRFGGDCRQAKRELLAAALNLATGRLSGDCCLGDGGTIRERLERVADDCHRERDCGDALRFLRRINDDGQVRDCDGRDGGGWGDDGDHHDGDRDRDHDRDHGGDWDRDGDWREGDGCCRPRSRGWWHRQCLGADRVHPTRGNGNAKGPGPHPQLSEEDRDRAIRHARRRLGRADLRPCDSLDSKKLGGKQAKAEAEVATLALNEGAGYLDGCRRAERQLDRAIRLLKDERWDEAWRTAHEGNHAKGGLRRCDDDSDDEDDDDGWDRDGDGHRHRGGDHEELDDGDDDAPGKSGSKGKGKEKGKDKGKGKSQGKGKKG